MPKQTLESLQMGRGLAALMVVFVHYNVAPLGRVWESGVDFFFVLSGFIIFYVHHEDFGNHKKLWHYFYRRLVRIYPIYWLIIGSYLGTHYLLGNNLKDFYHANTSGIIKTIILAGNHPLVILTSWTLAYEVFFYLLIALRFIFRQRSIFYFFFLVPILGFLNIKFLPVSGFYYSSFFLEALLGIATFSFFQRKSISLKLIYFLIFSGVILLGILPYLNAGERFIIRGIPSFIIIFALVGWEKNQKIKIPAFFMHLGNASYMLYLSHTILLSTLSSFIPKLDFIPVLLLRLFIVILTILCAVLAHYYVEKPILKFLRKLSGTQPTKNTGV